MGFNLGAFSAGVLGGVADTVTKQRKDIDSRIDKYLDFGVQRGTEIMDKRVEEKKQYINLGNQLKQRQLSNDQVSVLLEGGLESATAFLDSIRTKEKSLPTGETVDASGLVTMQGKPSGVTWEDYVDQTIMGTVNTSDVYSNTGVAPVGGSILDKMFGNTTPQSVSSSSVRNRAGLASGLGYSVEESLAASSNSFDRQRDDKVAQGFVRYAGDPKAQQDLLNSQRAYKVDGLRMEQLEAVIKSDKLTAIDTLAKRTYEALERKYKTTLIKYKITNDMGVEELQVKHDAMLAKAKLDSTPSSFEQAEVYLAFSLREEMSKPKEEQSQKIIENIQSDITHIRMASALANANKSTTKNPFTSDILTKVYVASLKSRMYERFAGEKPGSFYFSNTGQPMLLNPSNPEHVALMQGVLKDAGDDWMDNVTSLGATGVPLELLKKVYAPWRVIEPVGGTEEGTEEGTDSTAPRFNEDGQPSFITKQRSGEGTKLNPLPLVEVPDMSPTSYYTTMKKSGGTGSVLGSDLITQFKKSQASLILNDFKLPTGTMGTPIEVKDMKGMTVTYMVGDAQDAANKYIQEGSSDKADALLTQLKDIAKQLPRQKDVDKVKAVIATLSAFVK
jgi:hypothetical protein